MVSKSESAEQKGRPVETKPTEPPPSSCDPTDSPLANLAFCYRCGNPMTQGELWTKFSGCAGRVLPQPQIAPLFAKLAAIETIGSVRELTGLLAVA